MSFSTFPCGLIQHCMVGKGALLDLKKKEQFRRSKDFVMEMKHFMQRPKQNIFCSRLMQILYVLVPKRLSAYGKGSIFFLFAINVILNFLPSRVESPRWITLFNEIFVQAFTLKKLSIRACSPC